MALTDNLVGYWKLDEASGTRNDAVGSAHLTDTGTVGSATGKVGTAADVELGNYLTVADPAALSFPGDTDFTVAAWLQFESKAADEMFAVGKGDGDGAEYGIEWNPGSDRLQFAVYASDGFGTGQSATASTLGSPALATWYYVVGWYDATAEEVRIQVNNGTVDAASYTAGSYNSDAAFTIGSYPAFNLHWDGLIDEVGIWSRVLTTEERTTLYNGGAGLTYPFTVSAQPVMMTTFVQ